MNRDEFIGMMSKNLKLVRTEFGLNQDKMAYCLGISKKTLVEIEKERSQLGWTGAAALAEIFSDSSVLQNAFGGEMSDLVKALAFDDTTVNFRQTHGGKVWWKQIEETDKWKIQQNYISQHYRLLTAGNRCVYSSFHLEKVRQAADEYEKNME